MLARFMRSQYAFPAAILAVAAIAGIVVLIASSGGDDGGGTEVRLQGGPRAAAQERRGQGEAEVETGP